MQSYDWPGNVRELEHMLMRASLKATRHKAGRPLILADHLDLPVSTISVQAEQDITATDILTLPSEQGLRESIDRFQKALIIKALEANDGNWSATARELKTDRANLNRLALRLGIKQGSSS